MAKYRSDLPQMSGELFLTDSGMETTLIFHKGLELPGFASFTLLAGPFGSNYEVPSASSVSRLRALA
jgi:homocysteine S-methyltransferase